MRMQTEEDQNPLCEVEQTPAWNSKHQTHWARQTDQSLKQDQTLQVTPLRTPPKGDNLEKFQIASNSAAGQERIEVQEQSGQRVQYPTIITEDVCLGLALDEACQSFNTLNNKFEQHQECNNLPESIFNQ